MQHKLETLADPTAVAAAGAAFVAELARAAVAARDRFHFAVSGGHTPWAMFAELASEQVPWEAVVSHQVDERVAPAGGSRPEPYPPQPGAGGCRRGQTIQPAVMAISGPICAVPRSYIRVRYLTVSGWWPR